jgi:hypothetical protein
MDTIRKDLKVKIEAIEKVEKQKRKNNDIKIITAERNFFRQEAIRLNELCKEINNKLEGLSSEYKIKNDELFLVTKKWKGSENTNKQLIVELERNISINNELNALLNSSQKNYQESSRLVTKPDVEYNKEEVEGLLSRLKFELKKERGRNHKILSEFNKVMQESNKLEKIFLECYEESRKDIFNRKIKDSLSSKYQSKRETGIPSIYDVKYENFLPSDKRRLIENFIIKDEVLNLIKENMFKKSEEVFTMNDYRSSKEDEIFFNTKSSFLKSDKMFYRTLQKKKLPSASSGLSLRPNNIFL